LPYDKPAFFIAPSDDLSRRSLALDLSLIGIDEIAGVMRLEDLDELIALVGTQKIDSSDSESAMTKKEATILDVRARSEYAHGHVPNSINIPLSELQSRLDELPAGDVVVHCQGGSRSVIAASILQREGGQGVKNLPGGFAEWERKGHPVERGTKKTGA
jgi:hydroxyacylglutathione hydrolase